ncbi:YgfZ/GcvT domain-containing protein [Montanilutibacter psychrotolerans]|uniref:Folate-binding protein n=1 Tax=Montanilutibacter psychrotolerans TaxID=1327343 RepID=A0A3M8SQY8_9GAMM|nr:folate-binding protein YgfZ [Lysobacter psychrotolerans]RNF83183.1 folate-binding protein [Lysobacter psychrotolerans]
MHDNPQAASGRHFALSGTSVATLEGRDAAAFAQAQFCNDVTAITPGQWQWSGWLTPKGRVMALFALLKRSDESLLLWLPDANAVAFCDALRRFVFRSKVVVRPREDLFASGRFEAPAVANGNTFDDRAGSGALELDLELDLGADGGPRCLRIGADAGAEDAAAMAQWAAFDLAHGLPRLPESQVEHWTPQQLSLQRLNAFSVKKGCYPGQEIVARTHFLGKVKRGLALLEGGGRIDPGAEVRAGDTAIGNVVCAAGNRFALAVLPLERTPSALAIGGMPVQELTLREGLAR